MNQDLLRDDTLMQEYGVIWMDPRILSFTASMDRRRGASAEEIEAMFSPLSFNPPSDYLQFMSLTNGSEGPIGTDDYLAIYGTRELLDCNAQTMEMEPGILFFGTNRGGTGYAFEFDKQPTAIVAIEFAELDRSRARIMGRTFLEFLEILHTSKFEASS